MTLTYHKSATEAGGAIGGAITDGGLNDLFMPVTVAQITNGDTILDKMWVTPDEDGSIYIGISQGSKFPAYVFQSAGTDDTETDLTGTEDRYGGEVVTANPDATTLEVAEDSNVTKWRSGDKVVFINGSVKEIDTVSTASGTTTLTFTSSVGTSNTGDWISSVFLLNMTASTDYPFWIDQRVPASFDTQGDNYNTVTILEMY